MSSEQESWLSFNRVFLSKVLQRLEGQRRRQCGGCRSPGPCSLTPWSSLRISRTLFHLAPAVMEFFMNHEVLSGLVLLKPWRQTHGAGSNPEGCFTLPSQPSGLSKHPCPHLYNGIRQPPSRGAVWVRTVSFSACICTVIPTLTLPTTFHSLLHTAEGSLGRGCPVGLVK